MVAALAGAVTFAVSMRRLVTDPAQYGKNFDAMLLPQTEEMPAALLQLLQSHPDITDVTLYTLAPPTRRVRTMGCSSPAWNRCGAASSRTSSASAGSRSGRGRSPSAVSLLGDSTWRSVIAWS